MLAAADAYGRLKRYDAAVRIAREAAAKNPESTDALFRLASSLERGGNPAEGEKVFLQLLAMRPNDSATQNYLGYMWADQGVQLDKAKDMLEKAVAREPRNAAYLDSLGWAYFRLGRAPERRQEPARGLPARAGGPHDRGAHRRPRGAAGQRRGRDPPLGESARAQARGAGSRARKAPEGARARLAALNLRSPRLPLLVVLLCALASRARRHATAAPLRPGDARSAAAGARRLERRGQRAPRAFPPPAFSTTRRWPPAAAPSVPGTLAVSYDGKAVTLASLTGPFGSRVAEYRDGAVTGEDRKALVVDPGRAALGARRAPGARTRRRFRSRAATRASAC